MINETGRGLSPSAFVLSSLPSAAFLFVVLAIRLVFVVLRVILRIGKRGGSGVADVMVFAHLDDPAMEIRCGVCLSQLRLLVLGTCFTGWITCLVVVVVNYDRFWVMFVFIMMMTMILLFL